ncbi:hypothetical protein [Natronogracilivirga saccharolytica]|uniref:Uncharacterized protein n=1 Tax=Natronogracilivirga saccharolytica TaxID=2812953 RepID=A0A8J7RKE5_9BACT|nr:hypothetical protein [Natronogracilivirga saccharolytica]MBP3193345.1 hypothetical protein [Natronogracilivirga saccharolytica]
MFKIFGFKAVRGSIHSNNHAPVRPGYSRFEWPRDESIEVVKNGYIYTLQTDEETGLQQINRYRFEWN